MVDRIHHSFVEIVWTLAAFAASLTVSALLLCTSFLFHIGHMLYGLRCICLPLISELCVYVASFAPAAQVTLMTMLTSLNY